MLARFLILVAGLLAGASVHAQYNKLQCDRELGRCRAHCTGLYTRGECLKACQSEYRDRCLDYSTVDPRKSSGPSSPDRGSASRSGRGETSATQGPATRSRAQEPTTSPPGGVSLGTGIDKFFLPGTELGDLAEKMRSAPTMPHDMRLIDRCVKRSGESRVTCGCATRGLERDPAAAQLRYTGLAAPKGLHSGLKGQERLIRSDAASIVQCKRADKEDEKVRPQWMQTCSVVHKIHREICGCAFDESKAQFDLKEMAVVRDGFMGKPVPLSELMGPRNPFYVSIQFRLLAIEGKCGAASLTQRIFPAGGN